MPKNRFYMSKGKKDKKAEYYAGYDPRKRQEMQDSTMIREDQSAVANMPQGVIQKFYAKPGKIDTPYLDDTIRGIDVQMDSDVKESKRKSYPEKY